MTLLQALGGVAYNVIRRLASPSRTLTMKTVQAWINEHSNRDDYGRGYAGNRLSRGPSSGFVEVVKQARGSAGVSVRAEVYLDPKQGAAASKSWEATTLDGDLQKFFGKNLRVRINI